MIGDKDPFAVANLQATVYWSYKESIYGLAYIGVLIVAGILFALKQVRWGVSILLISTCWIIQWVVILFTPRISLYTQDAAVRFYQGKVEELCYIEALGFKSYAPLFYAEKSKDLPHLNQEDLLEGHVEYPVYFVAKIYKKDRYLDDYPQLEWLY